MRREPQGKAQILMRGDAGTLLAVKDSRGKWRLVVYRDPLTDQLSEGWVFAPAGELLNIPEQ
ncbi:SH3 domain-containing protein [Novosphingobium panipatense]